MDALAETRNRLVAVLTVANIESGLAQFRIRYRQKSLNIAVHRGAVNVQLGNGTAQTVPAGAELPVRLRKDGRIRTIDPLRPANLSDSDEHFFAIGSDKAWFPLAVGPLNGKGAIASSPPGIACPKDCDEPYSPGKQITLTPHPDPSWILSAWDGACSGWKACVVTMEEPTRVGATFVLISSLPDLQIINLDGLALP
jgi:hypothetical protein